MPLQWAATQNNLGNALQNLGEREDGTERLEQAVTAYNAALEVRTREQVPLDWAMTQNNLGAALATLGGAQSCRNPKNRKQNNLGAALATLGAREDGTERLEQAVTAYNAALEVYTREQVPLQWAATQNNLGKLPSRTWGSARTGPSGSNRPSPPTTPPSKCAPASRCRYSGPTRSTISGTPSCADSGANRSPIPIQTDH